MGDMDALDEEIAKLEAEIKGYEAEYATASSEARKDRLLDAIIAASQNLTELEKRKTGALSGGNASDTELMKRYIDGFEKGLAVASAKRARHDTDKTPSDYALRVKRQLGDCCTTVTSGEGLSFLTEAECADARARITAAGSHERHLVAFMTPIIRERLLSTMPHGYVLVNSEEYGWIPQSADLKENYHAPDHFIAPEYLVEFRPPYKDAPPCDGLYGTFPVFNARRSLVAIGDAKKKLDPRGEGEFMKHLKALSYPDSNNLGATIRGFVYDWEKCTLMTASNGHITQITAVQWMTPGSLAVIRNYFSFGDYKRDFHEGLQLACMALRVTLPRYSSDPHNCGRCVLGAGAYGTVFEVLRGEERLALKFALDEDCVELAKEFENAKGLPADALSSVISVESRFLFRGSLARGGRVAAFLLSTVGIPFSHADDVKDEHGPLILESLSDLHAAGVCHGDARYKNVVRVEYEGPSKRVEFRWIDFSKRGVANSVHFKEDITMFFESIGRLYDEDAVSRFAQSTADKSWRGVEERRRAARELWNYDL